MSEPYGIYKEVALFINKELADLPPARSEPFEDGAYNFLLELLRYDPCGLHVLDVLREEKLRYLQSVLKRRSEWSLDRYVMSLEKFEGKNFFIGNKNLDDLGITWSKDLVDALLLTSCFMVELFRKYKNEGLRDQDDPIFNVAENLPILRHFLISVLTQFPLYLLVEFFNMTRVEGEKPGNFVDLALYFFENMVGHTLKPPPHHDQIPMDDIKHLLGLIHYCLCPLSVERAIPPTTKTEIEREFINYASELEEFGIKFKMNKEVNATLFDISFEKREMKIASLKVAESTLELLRNLIKYEMKFPISDRRYVSDYIKFILCLINSPEDVKVLRRCGIIENWIGNDKVIFDALENLGRGVDISRSFTYSGVIEKVNQHCKHRRNLWMAKLQRNYFNSPWSLISFIAAVMLLLLTITQTVYSILSYHCK